ncbi:MAG: type II toxin-antitoxin system VapB family antitoxin [Pseudomonadota bacterium]|jgi:hypothetical protein
MRTTLTISDDLFNKAMALAPAGMDKADLIRECVKAFIREQSAQRLAALGGTLPNIQQTPRRREPAGSKQP